LAEKLIEEIIGDDLRRLGWKLAVAESITGGLIGHRITNIPGSSEYYLGGVGAYAYEAKERLLGVQHETLLKFGAVSQETVLEMATGARRALQADASVAVTGIAGPGGGMPNKPVGLVWIGVSTPQGDSTWKFVWDGNRLENKTRTADKALELLHLTLLKARMEVVEVRTRPDRQGRLIPVDFSWHGAPQMVESTGRRRVDAEGEHIVCRAASGSVFTLLHSPVEGRWFVEKVSPARASV
jgi:PncC family amidohydrolase